MCGDGVVNVATCKILNGGGGGGGGGRGGWGGGGGLILQEANVE